jgi:hypothetical protein
MNSFGNPFFNNGKGNFIQIKFKDNFYFRVGTDEHYKILEDFLKEANITDYDTKICYQNLYFFLYPSEKSKLYELIGCGVIEKATNIEECIEELDNPKYYAISSPSFNYYSLYPNITHLSKICKQFEYPLIFIGPTEFTEEERGFMESYEEQMEKEEYGSFEELGEIDGPAF